jgi:P27 family predicted phage terminase small subunit
VKKLESTPLITRAGTGFLVQTPLINIINQSFKQMKSILLEFGMTPSARGKVSVPSKEAATEEDRFFNRKRSR